MSSVKKIYTYLIGSAKAAGPGISEAGKGIKNAAKATVPGFNETTAGLRKAGEDAWPDLKLAGEEIKAGAESIVNKAKNWWKSL